MRCPNCAFGKLKPAPGYWGGPLLYGCSWHAGHIFGTVDTGCGWTGPKPPGLLGRLVRWARSDSNGLRHSHRVYSPARLSNSGARPCAHSNECGFFDNCGRPDCCPTLDRVFRSGDRSDT